MAHAVDAVARERYRFPMPTTLEALLAKRASDLAPTSTQLDAAKRSQRFLRDQLNTGQMGERIVDSYLIGSYARHTALQPLDDVDIVFVINPKAWQRLLSKVFNLLPPPDRLLRSFAAAIRSRYNESRVQVQRRSVGLKMHRLSIDAVPAVPHPKNANWILVPDRDKDEWIASGPRVHSATATAVNKAASGTFLPAVRLLKAWNSSLPSTASLKGFAVETMATRLFSKHPLPSLLDGVDLFLDFVAARGGLKSARKWSENCDVSFSWPKSLPDTAGTGQNLFGGVDGERIAKFSKAATVARDAIAKARNARSLDGAWEYLDKRFPL